jgi:hypothetical protein
MAGDLAWECECGNVEYGAMAPEECEKCFGIDCFTQLPAELIDERAKDSMEDDLEMDLENPMKSAKKPRLTKPKAKKKRK